jgi:hypothetical protein|tara:strand:+ start:2686 stop:2997 length:312 start_codon:yes stop_codon:yes gene_type:complete
MKQPHIDNVDFRFNENKILAEALDYIASTYGGHYVGDKAGTKDENIQTIDIWKTLGSVDTTCRDTAIKYLMRYGKKDGFNKKDLLKTIHYTLLLWHFTQDEGQ